MATPSAPWCKQLSEHVLQIGVPTPTLPPSYETNTYVIHHDTEAILVDAGSQDEDVLDQVVSMVRAQNIHCVRVLLATHYHRDHIQGLPYLQEQYHCPIHIHAADLQNAQAEWNRPCDAFPMEASYSLAGLAVQVEHHPGHTHGHVHILIPEDGVILVGDHLAGDGSVWIGPPDGHMASYYQALSAIASSECQIAGPGHGASLDSAARAAQTLLTRRQQRELEIFRLVQSEPKTKSEIVQTLYSGAIPEAAMWVAVKTVQAHLQHLLEQRQIQRRYAVESGFMYFVPSE